MSQPKTENKTSTGKPGVLIGGEFLRMGRRPPPKPSRDGTIALVVGGVALLLALGAGVLALVGMGGPPQPTEAELTASAVAVQETAGAFAALQSGLGAVELGQTAVATEVSVVLAGLQVTLTADSAALIAQVANLQATVDTMGTAQAQPTVVLTPTPTDTVTPDPSGATDASAGASGETSSSAPPTEAATVEPAAATGELVTLTIASNNPNIRSQPNANSASLGALNQGTVLPIVAKIDLGLGTTTQPRYWVQVRLTENGQPLQGVRLITTEQPAEFGFIALIVVERDLEDTTGEVLYNSLDVPTRQTADFANPTTTPTGSGTENGDS